MSQLCLYLRWTQFIFYTAGLTLFAALYIRIPEYMFSLMGPAYLLQVVTCPVVLTSGLCGIFMAAVCIAFFFVFMKELQKAFIYLCISISVLNLYLYLVILFVWVKICE